MQINKEHLPKLIAQFAHIKQVMEEVAQDSTSLLQMQAWVNLEHPCGTAACVMGYVAIAENPEKDTERYLCSKASDLATDLDFANTQVFQNVYLSQSVWDAFTDDRFSNALSSSMFTDAEVAGFKHLTYDTTPQDVVDYLDAIITKLEAL